MSGQPLRIRVRLFAGVRERAGRADLDLEVAPPATVAAVWDRLRAAHPALEPFARAVRFAVNRTYVDPEHVLADGDELAVIPPVSGGRS